VKSHQFKEGKTIDHVYFNKVACPAMAKTMKLSTHARRSWIIEETTRECGANSVLANKNKKIYTHTYIHTHTHSYTHILTHTHTLHLWLSGRCCNPLFVKAKLKHLAQYNYLVISE
jgi:hypothetical protein